MAPQKRELTLSKAQANRLIELLEDTFMLHALNAKVSVEGIRRHLKIDKWRVSKVSVMLKSRKPGKG